MIFYLVYFRRRATDFLCDSVGNLGSKRLISADVIYGMKTDSSARISLLVKLYSESIKTLFFRLFSNTKLLTETSEYARNNFKGHLRIGYYRRGKNTSVTKTIFEYKLNL